MRIVLAEDSALFREGLARLLAEKGHDVVASVGDADAPRLEPAGELVRALVELGPRPHVLGAVDGDEHERPLVGAGAPQVRDAGAVAGRSDLQVHHGI